MDQEWTYEPGTTNLFQHLRQCHKVLYDQYMAKKNPLTWGHFLFFCHMPVCSRDILLELYLVIILPYVCSRDMLQLFDKALIGFSFGNMFQIHTECIHDCLFLSEYKSYLSTLRICACISYQNTVDLKGLQIPVGLNECCMTEQSSVC